MAYEISWHLTKGSGTLAPPFSGEAEASLPDFIRVSVHGRYIYDFLTGLCQLLIVICFGRDKVS